MAVNIASSSPAVVAIMMRSPGPSSSSSSSSSLFVAVFVLLSLVHRCHPTITVEAEVDDHLHGHVRHKRTVSDFFEGLMNAMQFYVEPEPMPSTVIARITHMPATKVYKYIPVSTVKLSKLRAHRHIAEPKFKVKYPKKYSIKTPDASLTLVKNDLPWTLHPLPPPLPTAKTIKLEVDKSMPWALHPLPPPVKTKSYAEYYWPDAKTRPKYGAYHHRFKPPQRPSPHRFNNNYKYIKSKPSSSGFRKPYKPVVDYKPVAVDYGHTDGGGGDYNNHVDDENNENENDHDHDNNHPHHHNQQLQQQQQQHHQQQHHHHNKHKPGAGAAEYNNQQNKPDDYKYEDGNEKPDDYQNGHPVDFKHIDFKQVDFKQLDYKSPDYKNGAAGDEEHEGGGDDHGEEFHAGFSHDDHGDEGPDTNDASSQPPVTDFVSHITIEPSIQIAAFSDTELQGDGSNRDSVSQGDKHRCQCTVNGHNGAPVVHHRHKRDVQDHSSNGTDTANGTAEAPEGRAADLDEAHSTPYRGYSSPDVGHATEVQILRSHDISDLSTVNVNAAPSFFTKRVRDNGGGGGGGGGGHQRPAQGSSNNNPNPNNNNNEQAKKYDSIFRDESDKFKLDLGRDINFWDFKGGQKPSDQGQSQNGGRDDGGGGGGGGVDGSYDDFGGKKPDPKNYHIITTVKTTSNQAVDDDDRPGSGYSVRTPFSVSSFSSNIRHPLTDDRFRFDTSSSPLSSSFRSSGYNSEPLDFEQFGLKSALDDRPLGGSSFSRDNFGGSDGFSDDGFSGGRLLGGSPFSRDFSRDRSRLRSSRPSDRFRSQLSTADLFGDGDRFKSSRSSSDGDSRTLEYFQPVVIDFDRSKGSNDKSRLLGKTTDSGGGGFAKFKRNQNSDPLRLPNGLHESTENLARKMVFHPSTFDSD